MLVLNFYFLQPNSEKRTMKISKIFLQTISVAVLVFTSAFAQAQDIKVVYHVNTDVNTASAILGNVRNHLNADPKVKITVVTHGPGIDFLLDGAKDNKGRNSVAWWQTWLARASSFASATTPW